MHMRINPITGQMNLAGLEYVIKTVPPTPDDNDYTVPCLWHDSVHGAAWLLLQVSGGVAYWSLLALVIPYPAGAESGEDLVTEAGDTIVLN